MPLRLDEGIQDGPTPGTNHSSIFGKPNPGLVYFSTTASRLQQPQTVIGGTSHLQAWKHGAMHPEGTASVTTSAHTDDQHIGTSPVEL